MCLIDSLRAHRLKVPYKADGPFWAVSHGNEFLQPWQHLGRFCTLIFNVPSVTYHQKHVDAHSFDGLSFSHSGFCWNLFLTQALNLPHPVHRPGKGWPVHSCIPEALRGVSGFGGRCRDQFWPQILHVAEVRAKEQFFRPCGIRA